MGKYVVYRDFYRGFCVTPLENYGATVKDANKVVRILGAKSAEEAANALRTYSGFSCNDLIIVKD